MYNEEVDHLFIRNAMSGKFLTHLSAKVRAELKQNLKNNAVIAGACLRGHRFTALRIL